MKIKTSVVLLALAGMGGCVPYYAGYEQNMYAPGGALADKQEGPAILASSTDASLNAMFPKGTQKTVVMQALGNPMTSSTSTDGKSSQVYMHTFTSYSRKMVNTNMLTVEYDKNGGVSNLTLSKSNSTW